ncbi:M23 family metallopeptidase [Barnesiella viscericola]|uniref:M23 family metallopeptidase n=1 Tax=Barnesiella viscericola TaxID=397865 RepID=UPI00320B671F
MRLRTIGLGVICALIAPVCRGEMIAPLKIPLLMSANFGELRPNHFHSGIDLKTQGRTGLPVYAMDGGYVSRVVVSPWGFGRAIYINHPSGLTTVYGHLKSFAPFIDEIVRRLQYEQEDFAIDCEFAEGEIPVGQGDLIGYSGNAGSSGGPHLHLDIRDTATEDPMDPQEWLSQYITDDVAPEPRRVVVYTHDGVLGNTARRVERKATRSGAGSYSIGTPVPVWGDVSFGIEAYDRMTGTANKYGVHQVDLYVDDSLFFSTYIYRYSFDETRYINSFTEDGKIMRTYVAPGNRLRSIYKQVDNHGILHVDEERLYRCRYVLTDYDGNRSELNFTLTGKLQAPVEPQKSGIYFSYAVDNLYKKDDFGLFVPAGALYENIDFTRRKLESHKYYSDTQVIGPDDISLHRPADLSIRLTRDELTNKNQYYLVRLKGNRVYPVNGEYADGWYKAKIRNFGSYAVTVDSVNPSIQPVAPERWSSRGTVVLKVTDSGSGLKSYRGEIDGKFVLFELDGKTARITYRLESNRVKKGSKHTLKVRATDMCGNEQVYTGSFVW